LEGNKLEIKKVLVKDLTLDPNNARRHSARNLEVIANSLKDFGQRKPIVVTESGLVVAGNGTLEAARSIGWESIEVTYVPASWTHDQVKAFALVDNRAAELAEWDTTILAEQLMDLSGLFDIQTFGFNPLEQQPEEEQAPDDFKEISTETLTDYCCPKCSYEWNGKPR
jgi:ParB-like chromosome segregation protein Spo0J